MKGATGILGSMNRSMNLPALQRIAMEFEKENDIMDQRQEMMDDAIDDATMEDEGAEDEVVEQVLEEIGIDLRQAVSLFPMILYYQRRNATLSKIDNADLKRWVILPRESKARVWQSRNRLKLLESVEEIPETMIFKQDSIVYDVEVYAERANGRLAYSRDNFMTNWRKYRQATSRRSLQNSNIWLLGC